MTGPSRPRERRFAVAILWLLLAAVVWNASPLGSEPPNTGDRSGRFRLWSSPELADMAEEIRAVTPLRDLPYLRLERLAGGGTLVTYPSSIGDPEWVEDGRDPRAAAGASLPAVPRHVLHELRVVGLARMTLSLDGGYDPRLTPSEAARLDDRVVARGELRTRYPYRIVAPPGASQVDRVRVMAHDSALYFVDERLLAEGRER